MNRSLKISIFIAISCISTLFGANSSLQEQFNSANQLYEKGELDKSGEIYSSLLAQGYGGSALFYNMGNVSYRQGDRGHAVLWFERAKRLAPRDNDIDFNLTLARSHLKDQTENWLHNFVFYLTSNELSLLVSLLLWSFLVVFGSMAMGWIRAEIWPGLSLWITGFLLVIFGVWLGAHTIWDNQPTAVVTHAAAEVRNGPGTDYAVGFTVPEGSEVLVLNRRPDWVQIGVVDQGLKGWISAKDVETIKLMSEAS